MFAGVEMIGDIAWAAELTGNTDDTGWSWFLFRAPKAPLFVIQQDGTRSGS